MKRHPSFFRGIFVGIALIIIIDLPLIHWLFGWHRAFSHPSVDILEPMGFVLAIVVLIFILRREYQE